FHTGGVAGVADITHGLPRVVELFEARKPKALAHVAKFDGWVRIVEDDTRPGLAHVVLTEPEYTELDDTGAGSGRAPVREPAPPGPGWRGGGGPGRAPSSAAGGRSPPTSWPPSRGSTCRRSEPSRASGP